VSGKQCSTLQNAFCAIAICQRITRDIEEVCSEMEKAPVGRSGANGDNGMIFNMIGYIRRILAPVPKNKILIEI